jgi:hypothetical protein
MAVLSKHQSLDKQHWQAARPGKIISAPHPPTQQETAVKIVEIREDHPHQLAHPQRLHRL